MVTLTSLGKKIKDLRAERGWTQNELAVRSSVDRGAIASIETGKAKNPTTANMLKLAHAFNINVKELYGVAGYIPEDGEKAEETPKQLIESKKINVRRLEKMLDEHHSESDFQQVKEKAE